MDTKGVSWEERFLMLTPTRLLISKVDDPEHKVADFIYMHDIVECEFKEEEEEERQIRVEADPNGGDEKMLEVIIRTFEDGYNCGRSYIYRSAYQDSLDWEAAIDKAVEEAKNARDERELQENYGDNAVAMWSSKCDEEGR